METAYRPPVPSEIDPHSDWVRGDKFDTLIVDVLEFTKDQLKVEVDPSGSLKIIGESAVNGGRQRFHFLKQFDLPGGYVDAAAIKVQFDKGLLYVQVPHPSAAGGGSEQHPTTELYEDTLAGEETPRDVWSGRAAGDGHPKWRLVLNVVLAVFLLWLVVYANYKPSGGQIKNK